MKDYVKEFNDIVLDDSSCDGEIISAAVRIIGELQAERNRFDTEIIRLKTRLDYPESKMLEHRKEL